MTLGFRRPNTMATTEAAAMAAGTDTALVTDTEIQATVTGANSAV
jgi:hypothetical protein